MASKKREWVRLRIQNYSEDGCCNLGDCNISDDDLNWVLSELAATNKITELSFENNVLTDEGVIKIAKFATARPEIRSLNLSRNRVITDRGAIALLDIIHLHELKLYRNSKITDRFAESVLLAGQITSVDIRETGISHYKQAEVLKKVRERSQESGTSALTDSTEDNNDATSYRSY